MGRQRAGERERGAAWQAFSRMYAQLDAELAHRVQRTSGMSAADHAVLCALRRAPEGSMRSRELRCALLWEKSRLAHQVRRMEERGLVARSVCDDDARAAVVHLTDAGRAWIAEVEPGYERDLRELFFDVLDADQLRALTSISEAVLTRLAEVTDPPAPS